MIVNGVDLSVLIPQFPAKNFPATVPGRVVHIDADFLAYMVSYEKEGTQILLEDMQHNCRTAIESMRRMAGAESVYLHLTPSSSNKGGRSELAILKEYQGSRKDKPKPAKLHIMRDWMGKAFPATLHQFCEADDGMSSSQYAAFANRSSNLSIICSKDKDLNMVPGLHLDWDSGEISDSITPFGEIYLDESTSTKKIKGYGQKFFWAQMLMGDQADTISGLPLVCHSSLSKPKKVGPVLTYSLLCGIGNNREAFSYVKDLYSRYGTEIGFKHWQTGEAVHWGKAFVSEAQLLWMRMNKEDPNDVLTFFKRIA